MSPPESKTSTNPNRLRCFKKSALVQENVSQKWDLVKIICSQPFNEQVQYGLSSIKLHIEKETMCSYTTQHQATTKENSSKLIAGRYRLREDSPDSENNTSMGLFSRWKTEKNKTGKFSETNIEKVDSSSSKKKGEHHSLLLQGKSTEKIETKVKVLDKDERDKSKEKQDQETASGSKRQSSSELQSPTPKKMKYQPFPSLDDKTTHVTNSLKANRTYIPGSSNPGISGKNKTFYKPFNKLLEGVTMVISGIEVCLLQS